MLVMQVDEDLFKIKLVVVILPNLFDVHGWCNYGAGQNVLIGKHLEYVWMNHTLAHLEVDFIIKAETHQVSNHASFIGTLAQRF